MKPIFSDSSSLISLHRKETLCPISPSQKMTLHYQNCLPSSAMQVRGVPPQLCRKWLFSPAPLMSSFTPCPAERLSNPPPFCHSAERPCTPVVLLHSAGSVPTVFIPLRRWAHARELKKGSSCCQTRWPEMN